MNFSRSGYVVTVVFLGTLTALFLWRVARLHETALELERAKAALSAGRLQEARSAAEAAIHWFTPLESREQAWLILGQVHLQTHDGSRNTSLAAAMDYLSRLSTKSQWYPQMCLLVAEQKMFEAKRPSEADAVVAAGLQSHPQSPELRRWIIERLTVTGRPEMAEPHLLAALSPGDHPAGPLTPAGIELLRTWLWSQLAPERIEHRFDRGLGVAGQFDEPSDLIRLERWHTLMARQPDEPANYAAVAQWYLDRQQLSVAAEWLQAGKSPAERNPDPYFFTVAIRLFCELQQPATARSMLERLQDLDAEFYTRWAAAWIARAAGETAEAKAHFELARQVWPGPIHRQLSLELEQLYRASDWESDQRQADQLQAERQQWELDRPALFAAIESLERPESRRHVSDWLERMGRAVEVKHLRR